MDEKESIKFEVIKKIAESRFRYKNLKSISCLNSASPPSVFIGSRLRYPLVNVGILSPLEKEEDAWIYDDEKYWADNNFGITEVIQLREELLNSRFQTKVSDIRSTDRSSRKFIELAQEIAVASRPVELEIELKKKVHIKQERDGIITPHSMRAPLKKARITSNVRIHKKIDRVINDEIKAREGIEYLYKNRFNEYVLNKILSVGVLGLKKDKKLVPTRWSITATDDTIGKFLLTKIKDCKWIENYEFFFGGFMGNQYLIFLFPDIFSFELFELYLPGSSWNPSSKIKASTDYEDYHGRKNYASNTAGGYYASRLPILEYLNKIKRQAAVLAIRIETPSYWASLGVWVVRESVRKTMKRKAIKFSEIDEFLEGGRQIGKIKFNFDIAQILKQSKLIKNIKTQKRLVEWVK